MDLSIINNKKDRNIHLHIIYTIYILYTHYNLVCSIKNVRRHYTMQVARNKTTCFGQLPVYTKRLFKSFYCRFFIISKVKW